MTSILIIEDDPALLVGLGDNFRQRGFDVTTASDGHTAMEAATSGNADVILLDIMLPGMNGLEICRHVRNIGLNTPIIMLTARTQEDDIVRGLDLGADDYITKPFGIRELVARVRALMRRLGDETEIVRFGDFELNLTSHTFHRNGKPIELTTKEFRLLALFLKRPGRALRRADILSRVWGDSIIVTNRSVDRCITTLRAKIETTPDRPRWITTVRNIGYRFDLHALDESTNR